MSEHAAEPFDDPVRRAILQRHGLGPDDFLGHGGEAHVFALDPDRVLRLHRNPDVSAASAYVRKIGGLYDTLDRDAVPYALPEVLDVREEERLWSIERRLPGRPFDRLLEGLSGDDRTRAISSYVESAAAFGALGVPADFGDGVGELLTAEQLRADTWGELLSARLARQLELGRPVVRDLVAGLDDAVERVLALARAEVASGRVLVHGDFFPGNVLFGDDLHVSAVLDLGWLTVVGDPTHDVRSAVAFWGVRPWAKPGDREALAAAARRHLGPDTDAMLDRTARFEQARFAFVAEDPHLLAWCVGGLRELAGSEPLADQDRSGATVRVDGP